MLQKLLKWENTVTKAWTKIQTLSLCPLLLAPYKTGRAPLTSAPDLHHCKWQVGGEKCNCLFIQSCALELNGVIPDVHQRCNRDQTPPAFFKSHPSSIPLAPFPSSILKGSPECLISTIAIHLKEIREPVYIVQVVGWYYRLLCCAFLLFFPSGHVHLRRKCLFLLLRFCLFVCL